MLRRRLAAIGLVLLTAACAGTPQSARLEAAFAAGETSLPRQAAVDGVPFFPQEDLWCGPAALATVQTWAGVPTKQEAAARQVYTQGAEGTLRPDMIAAVRRNGLLGTRVQGLRAVLAEVAAGHPVLVFQNLGLPLMPVWHYAVAVGYDLERQEVVLRSGRLAERITDLATFERTWARGDHWALVVTPPERLPATATEDAVLEAARGLERTGRTAEAAAAYSAIVKRWPASFTARFGRGNALLALDDAAAAESAYREALALRPDSAAAWNNLAYALHEQDRHAAAVTAARQAVEAAEKAGLDPAPYRDTLHDVAGTADIPA